MLYKDRETSAGNGIRYKNLLTSIKYQQILLINSHLRQKNCHTKRSIGLFSAIDVINKISLKGDHNRSNRTYNCHCQSCTPKASTTDRQHTTRRKLKWLPHPYSSLVVGIIFKRYNYRLTQPKPKSTGHYRGKVNTNPLTTPFRSLGL